MAEVCFGFGGGMFPGEWCGVVTGAAMGLAHLFASEEGAL